MANSKTEHSKKLRAETARKSAQKIIDEGGMRVNLLLEVQHAVRFKQLMEQEGSQKKHLLRYWTATGQLNGVRKNEPR